MTLPALPQAFVDTTMPVLTGTIWTPANATDFQTALDNCVRGDTIKLQAGVTYTGNFVLKAKTGTGWIIIRTDAQDSSLPLQGTRINPSYASVMPKLVMPGSSDGAITTVADETCSHYRFIGVEFGVAVGQTPFGIIWFYGAFATSLSHIPQMLILDRCYIHGNPTEGVKSGVQLHCRGGAVIDSYISAIHRTDSGDTQAILMYAGPGPYLIQNNYLEAAGENVMSGGAFPDVAGIIPTDVTFRRNHLKKPLSWYSQDPSYGGILWAVKNTFEIKAGLRWLIEGNIFENCWAQSQAGLMMALTPRNLAVGQDLTIRYNIFRSNSGGIGMLGQDDEQPPSPPSLKRVYIHNNSFYDIDYVRFAQPAGGTGRIFHVYQGTEDVIIEHNTWLLTNANKAVYQGTLLTIGDSSTGPNQYQRGLVVRDNLGHFGGYGIGTDQVGIGDNGLPTGAPGLVMAGNVFISPEGSYPTPTYGVGPSLYTTWPDNDWPVNETTVQFVNYAEENYRLASSSPYKNGGTDGFDPGANLDVVFQKTFGVEAGISEGSPRLIAHPVQSLMVP